MVSNLDGTQNGQKAYIIFFTHLCHDYGGYFRKNKNSKQLLTLSFNFILCNVTYDKIDMNINIKNSASCFNTVIFEVIF